MGVSPFIYGPVAVLGVLALLSVCGLGAPGNFGTINFADPDLDTSFYYDLNGNAICYRNLTAVAGQSQGQVIYYQYVPYAYWRNSTNVYAMYNDNVAGVQTKMTETWAVSSGSGSRGFEATISTELGVLAVISGIVAVGLIASVKFFGFGLSDTGINTLMKGGAYIMIWAIFSGLAMQLIINAGDFYTPIIYLGLTGAYTFGCLGDIGTPSSG